MPRILLWFSASVCLNRSQSSLRVRKITSIPSSEPPSFGLWDVEQDLSGEGGAERGQATGDDTEHKLVARHRELHQHVANAVREHVEAAHDEDEQVDLHQPVGDSRRERLVAPVERGHQTERRQHPLDSDVNGHDERGEDRKVGEGRPEQTLSPVRSRPPPHVPHLPPSTNSAPVRIVATNRSPNMAPTMNRGGTYASPSGMRMIRPARPRKVMLCQSAKTRQIRLKPIQTGPPNG